MIILKNVNKGFKGHKVLNNINLKFEEGNIYSLIGANGAGKTTLLSIMANILLPDSGDMTADDGVRNVYLLLSGERNLYYKNKVRDNIYYFSYIRGLSKRDVQYGIDKYCEKFNCISDLLEKKVENISFGQKKLVSIIISLICKSKCILLDEVSEGLDQTMKKLVASVLMDAKGDKIIIMASHDLDFISSCSDKNVYIDKGDIKSLSDKEELCTIKSNYDRFCNKN